MWCGCCGVGRPHDAALCWPLNPSMQLEVGRRPEQGRHERGGGLKKRPSVVCWPLPNALLLKKSVHVFNLSLPLCLSVFLSLSSPSLSLPLYFPSSSPLSICLSSSHSLSLPPFLCSPSFIHSLIPPFFCCGDLTGTRRLLKDPLKLFFKDGTAPGAMSPARLEQN